jgi:hypothetical protein
MAITRIYDNSAIRHYTYVLTRCNTNNLIILQLVNDISLVISNKRDTNEVLHTNHLQR